MSKLVSYVSAHTRSALAVAAIAVALAAGGSAWALTSGGNGSASQVRPTGAASSPGGSHHGRKGHHRRGRHHAVAGTISAINGTSWTVQTKRGAVLQVKLSPTTAFGSRKSPSTRDQFRVGMAVRVIGARSGKTITARRIVARKPRSGAPAG
ncbi:MAG: DUF5666 domain-containing protein [Acidimicrobiales bacterium]